MTTTDDVDPQRPLFPCQLCLDEHYTHHSELFWSDVLLDWVCEACWENANKYRLADGTPAPTKQEMSLTQDLKNSGILLY
jgi:hypothetical protein